MSIQRKSVLVESDGGYGGMVNDRLGAYVTYADHLAEVERLRQEWTTEVAPDGSHAFHTTYDVADDENVQHVMHLDPHGCSLKPWFDESDEFLSRSCPHPDGSDSVCYECNKERVVQEIRAAIRALKEKP